MTYPLLSRVLDGLDKPVELIAHGLGGDPGSSAFKVLFAREVVYVDWSDQSHRDSRADGVKWMRTG